MRQSTASSHINLHASRTLGEVVSEVYADGEEILLFIYVILVFFYDSTYISYFGGYIPWDKICRFVNRLREYVEVKL